MSIHPSHLGGQPLPVVAAAGLGLAMGQGWATPKCAGALPGSLVASTEVFVLLQYSTFTETISKEKCNGSVSSQQLSVPYCGWGSTQTPLSVPSILENNANSYNTKAFGKAVKTCKGYIYLSPQYAMEQEVYIAMGIVQTMQLQQNSWQADLDANSVIVDVQAFVHQTEKQISSDKHLELQNQKKVKKNVTHLEVFEGSHDSRKHPSSREVLKAVFCIQRYVRWWLEHRAFKRVKIKSTSHGPSLPAVVRYYRKMIACIKYQAGVLDSSTPLWYFELEEWMDKKRYFDGSLYSQGSVVEKIDVVVQLYVYETMFSKSESDKKMDRNYLPEFLRGCVCSIPASGIQRVFQLVCPASTAAVRSIKKHQAIKMAFTLFSPLGAKVKDLITVLLPWMHPLMDGKDGSKKLAFSHRKSKKADFQVSAALATSSIREGKENHLSDQDFWCDCMKSS
ncbi:LOW QUALITY PROTEIN: IQ domain-containing protein M [Spheniscus humboldti]